MAIFGKRRTQETRARDGRVQGNHQAAASREAETGEVRPALNDAALESRILDIGREIMDASRAGGPGMLSAAFWSDKLMDWAMKDEAFKAQLFRFVDAFPTLTTPDQVHDHLVDYLSQPGVTPPPGLGLGLRAGGLAKGAMTKTLTGQINNMAGRFIAGRTIADALPEMEKFWAKGVGSIINLLGEKCLSWPDADAARNRYCQVIEELAERAQRWPEQPNLEQDHLGAVPRAKVSVKLTALHPRLNLAAFDHSVRELSDSVMPILETAKRKNVHITFDMEHHALKELTLATFERCAAEIDGLSIGIVLQAYLRSGDEDAKRIAEWSKRTGRMISVRLVKGAYWDYETTHADECGAPVPVWSRKHDTDACFERMSGILLEASPKKPGDAGTKLALGSHNARSISAALALAERHGLPQKAVEIQMLYGMGPELKAAVLSRGLAVREYVPVGEMIPGMAYLVRRLLENTSNESWLLAGFHEKASADKLLASPHRSGQTNDPGELQYANRARRHRLAPPLPGAEMDEGFFNEAIPSLGSASAEQSFANAIGSLGDAKAPAPTSGGEVDQRLGALVEQQRGWANLDVADRAKAGAAAGRALKDARPELAARLVRDLSMSWADALQETTRAIDAFEFSARAVAGLDSESRLGRFVTEHNDRRLRPLGVCGLVPGWRNPLSDLGLLLGTAAVTGNASAIIATGPGRAITRRAVEVIQQANVGLNGVMALLVDGEGGAGGEGDSLISSIAADARMALLVAPDLDGELRRAVLRALADRPDGALAASAGLVTAPAIGNSIIVDISADPDDSLAAMLDACIGFQGQRRAACRRVLAVGEQYDRIVNRIEDALRPIPIGPAVNPLHELGPMADEALARNANALIARLDRGEAGAKLIAKRDDAAEMDDASSARLVMPRAYAIGDPAHAAALDPAPAPLLLVARMDSFEDAVRAANLGSPGVTVVESRKPSNIELARRACRAANVLINIAPGHERIGRQPWGAPAPAGLGAVIGGASLLERFVQPQVVTENMMRQGFAPDMEEATPAKD